MRSTHSPRRDCCETTYCQFGCHVARSIGGPVPPAGTVRGVGEVIGHGCFLRGTFANNLSGSVSGLVSSGLTLQDNLTPLRQLNGPAPNGTNVRDLARHSNGAINSFLRELFSEGGGDGQSTAQTRRVR